MIIKAQNGDSYQVFNVEQNAKSIKIQDPKDKRRKIVIGTYDSTERACEVMADIYTASKALKKEYVLPRD